jgi:hypothetical protein
MQFEILQDNRVVLPGDFPAPHTHRHYGPLDMLGWDGNSSAILMLMVQVRQPCVLKVTFNHNDVIDAEFRDPSGASSSWHEVIDRQFILPSGNECHIEIEKLPNQQTLGELRFSDVVLMWRTA